VVPVALNSGLCWSRNSLVLWPGTATARFLAPIPPGLPAEVFRRRLVDAIEDGSNALIRDAVAQGIARPIPPAWRIRLSELERNDVAPAATTD
jgi:1-acyl-sn-glycerol-3-phosphate acyltransferase